MFEKVKSFLADMDNQEVKESYLQIIITLLEKGYFPGLAGIPVVKSGISQIDGEKGVLTYRGYPVQELAEHCNYEDVYYLLLKGDLPLPEEQQELRAQLLANIKLDEKISKVIVNMDSNLHPMYMLSASVLLLQGNDPDCFDVDHYNKNLQRSFRLIAKLPSLIGTFRTGDEDFAAGKIFNSYSQYCLYCLNQELAADESWVDIFKKILILHADHTMNNSTFTVRAVGSSKASIYPSIASAINSLSGPLHGGANERVIKMLAEIGSPADVESYVDEKLENGEKIMGIGHRVYKTYDPRAIYVKENILPLIFGKNSIIEVDAELTNLYNIAREVEKTVLDKLSGKRLYPNVDFWSGLILRAMGIEPEYFTTVFAMGRIIGWSSHWVEHMKVKNRIYRPNQLYDGFGLRHIIVSPDGEEVIN